MTVLDGPRIVDGRSHRDDVERLFHSTILAGEPMSFPLAGVDHYANFCLNWYFTHASGHVLVAVDGNNVVGYALVCTAPNDYGRGVQRAIVTLAVRLLMQLASGNIGRESRAFYRDRLRDSWRIWRDRRRIDVHDEAHAHMNVAAQARTGTTAAELIAAIDFVVADAGFSSWVGEVNAEAGRRRRALERVVGTILDERPNITATNLLGRLVVRYTVRRSVPQT